MARAELVAQAVHRNGLNLTYSAAVADGHALNNAQHNVFLSVKNDAASAVTITIQTPGTVDGLPVDDLTIIVPPGDIYWMGPFSHGAYCKSDSVLSLKHAVWVDYSATTSITVAAFKVPDPVY